ncbi:hypothetical protein ACX0G9_11160 [Flavitalea flava]
MKCKVLVVAILFEALAFSPAALAQNYTAIEGSPYAGSMGVAGNPASIVNTPDPWDLTIFSLQVKNTTNALTLHNYSLLSPGGTTRYSWDGGNFRRYVAFDFNIHLFNARIAIGKNQAIAFGANLRGYETAKSGVFNYNDTLHDMNDFFRINGDNSYTANMTTSSWGEFFATYARTIWEDGRGRLNAGVTLRAMRGISGAFAQLKGATVTSSVSGDLTEYFVKAGSGRYGYSSNYDRWKKGRGTMDNLQDLVGNSRNGAAIDLGVEYRVKSQAVSNYYFGDTYYDYEWKIGVAILDIGQNSYKYGTQSRTVSNPRTDISDSLLNIKFNQVGSLAEFNDSMATIMKNIGNLNGLFKVWNPTRLVINIDKPLQDQFSVNVNLTINLTPSSPAKNYKQYYTKELTLLSVTPRWETRRLGAYLPIQVTTQGKLWVGGAFKAGPLLMGVHNWMNIFAKNKMQNGGFYLAFVLRPKNGFKDKEDKRYDCPPGVK